ncbi:PIH1 domain-containing protein 1-like [Rhopilema esculentum]|uniref:PIH1 domain-containing protein 1-like n=1 Tax=Rhopilema esculentum TaxID=499914 RepID=UPI0031D00093
MSEGNEKLLVGGIEEGSKLYDSLLLDSIKDPSSQIEQESRNVAPKPGFCLKTTDEKGNKVFVNACTSEGVLKPKNISEDELKEIFLAGDATKFRVPMAIGDAHVEKDKSGIDCTAYDIVINPAFLDQVNSNKFFMDFFITLIYEGLENKHDLKLSRDFRILKNKKAIGTLQMQTVRTKSTPVIMEMDKVMYELEKEHLAQQNLSQHPEKPSLIKELSTTKRPQKERSPCIIPEYNIIKEPPSGEPEYLIMEIKLPQVHSTKNIALDVGDDCVILLSNDGKLKLDVDLDHHVNNDATGAQFNKKTHILTITMPCS